MRPKLGQRVFKRRGFLREECVERDWGGEEEGAEERGGRVEGNESRGKRL